MSADLSRQDSLDPRKLTDAQLRDALQLAERSAAKLDLYYLATEILGYKDLTPTLHRPVCQLIQTINPLFQTIASGTTKAETLSQMRFLEPDDIPDSFKQFATWNPASKTRLFLMFRGSFKTTVISIAHTIQLMLLWPDIRILICSHKKDGGSAEILGAIKHHFIRNQRFRKLFPEYCPPENSLGQIEWGTSERVTLPNRSDRAAYPEATIEIAGATTDVTGRHYDYIKADDLVTRESVTNETMLAKTDEFNSLLKFLFNQPEWGVLDYAGTPYHFADLYAKLREEPITKVTVPVLDSAGNPTFPERFSQSGIERVKQDASMSSYVFSCQYMLNPVPPEDQTFRPEWFKRAGFYFDDPPQALNHYIFVDPANKQRKSSDYTALMHIGIDHRGDIWILDLIRDKLAVEGRIKLVFDTCKRWSLHKVYYETVGFQSTDAYNIRKHGTETGYHISVEEIRGTRTSKEDRIRGLQYLFESGSIHMPRCYEYYSQYDRRHIDLVEAFRKEAFMFPKCEHDDMLDCLSFTLSVRTHSVSTQVPPPEDTEFERVRKLAIESKNPKRQRFKYPHRKSSFYSVPAMKSFQKF